MSQGHSVPSVRRGTEPRTSHPLVPGTLAVWSFCHSTPPFYIQAVLHAARDRTDCSSLAIRRSSTSREYRAICEHASRISVSLASGDRRTCAHLANLWSRSMTTSILIPFLTHRRSARHLRRGALRHFMSTCRTLCRANLTSTT